MKIFIMTDMEGVCGVADRQYWVLPEGRYYEDGKKLLTYEINAAVEGFFNAGATEIHVADGHGSGGINHQLLDPRTYYIRGFPGPYPFNLDSSFDAMVFIGQHAKAGTEYAHISHTGSHFVIDCNINGISVGEFGQCAMCAAALGVRTIFLSGDAVAAKEAEALVRGIGTVEVKRGLMPGTGNECTFEEHVNRNIAAIHMHPDKARELIRGGAGKALESFRKDREAFPLLKLEAPFRMVTRYRPGSGKQGYTAVREHPTNFIDMMNSTERKI